ncbi:MAG: SMP-30/gluconolactonase/LRE family protein [Proteobacteria bacterium]|nr:SMP-30/gluconolactonase/LRE family protein [Pseudomonadota bacterium]
MNVEIRDERFRRVVGNDVAFAPIAQGCQFTEGPLWHARDHYLLFSDMPGDHLRRWTPGQGVTTFRKPCNQTNGLAWDAAGRLLACEHATSRLTRTEADGSITVLASHYDGRELNSPNDVVVHSSGTIYFTDPTYGRVEYYGRPRAPELDFRGVYCVRPDGSALTLLADDFEQPNGLCFSLDERRLFVNDTVRRHVRVFDVQVDGALANGRVWADTVGSKPGNPDGMKLDVAGNLYTCGPGGIHVFTPDAECLGVINTPEPVANFAFGDDDFRTLYITASSTVYRMRTATPGTRQMAA